MALIDLDLKNILVGKQIIGIINTELLTVISTVDPAEHKEKYIHLFLDEFLNKVDLTKSFNSKLILIYDEVLPTEILLAIHFWFHKKCCNLKNIILITTHTMGVEKWYQQYLRLFGYNGIRVIEAPLISTTYTKHKLTFSPIISKFNKDLKFYFSYYGGSYGSLERDFLATIFLDINLGYVDYMAGFTSNINQFNNYSEQQSNFLDRNFVDQIIQVRKNTNFKITTQEFAEPFGKKDGFQFNLDCQSACHIIRETMNDTPYSIVTEKTIRSFLHKQIPIPLGLEAIDNLEAVGFKFDHNIIDYSYQFESNFYKRMKLVCKQIENLSNNYTLKDLENYFSAHEDLLCYNYNYIASGKLISNIKEKIIREIDD